MAFQCKVLVTYSYTLNTGIVRDLYFFILEIKNMSKITTDCVHRGVYSRRRDEIEELIGS
jgi:hypothetical protein